MVPSLRNAGRSRDSDSVVVSARTPSSSLNTTGSPLRCGISTATTSSSNRPSFQARAASWWLRAANASCSSRVNSCEPVLAASVSPPIAWSVKASHRPSWAMWSRTVTSPYLYPDRERSSRCGACVIDSMPPATTTSNSPARMSWSARAMASMPDRQTLLIPERRDVHRDARGGRGLPVRGLPGARGEHLAEDHVLDLLRRHAGLLERPADGHRAEVGGGEVLERAEHPAHRGAGSGDDDGRAAGHGFLLRRRDGPSVRVRLTASRQRTHDPSATTSR